MKLVKFPALYYTSEKLCWQAAQLDLGGEAPVLNALNGLNDFNGFRARPAYQ
jgi:hypothetical protein